jgi:folate-dependent phosphoribosylglycinamide formyltransferase PurN
MKKMKIVLLTRDCDSTTIVYNYLKQHFDIDTVVFEKTISKSEQFRRRVKFIGFWNAVGQVIFMLTAFPFLKLTSQKRKGKIIAQYNLDLTNIPAEKIRRIDKLSSTKGRELLQELKPDLLVVNGTRILSKKTLESVPAAFVNIHTGITPAYRGVHGGYWSVAKGEKNFFGTTIHYVDAGVDTGDIIEQVFAEPGDKNNFYTYPYVQYATVLPVLKEVVQSFSEGQRPSTKPAVATESALWFHPTIFQWLGNLKRTFIFIGIIFYTSILS